MSAMRPIADLPGDIAERPLMTPYHDKLGLSISRYVVIQPNRQRTEPFKFDELFPGYKAPKDDDNDKGKGKDKDDEKSQSE